MRNRNELPKLDDSLFQVIENSQLAYAIGGKGTTKKKAAPKPSPKPPPPTKGHTLEFNVKWGGWECRKSDS